MAFEAGVEAFEAAGVVSVVVEVVVSEVVGEVVVAIEDAVVVGEEDMEIVTAIVITAAHTAHNHHHTVVVVDEVDMVEDVEDTVVVVQVAATVVTNNEADTALRSNRVVAATEVNSKAEVVTGQLPPLLRALTEQPQLQHEAATEPPKPQPVADTEQPKPNLNMEHRLEVMAAPHNQLPADMEHNSQLLPILTELKRLLQTLTHHHMEPQHKQPEVHMVRQPLQHLNMAAVLQHLRRSNNTAVTK